MVFAGIDLTTGRRPTAMAALSDDLRTLRVETRLTDAELLDFVEETGARIAGIDAPLGLPAGQCCLEESCACRPCGPGKGRECERALSRLGIGCYYTTKRSIIKAMVYRGIGLRRQLEERGCTVLEVYPYATKVRLFGPRPPRKTGPAGRAFLAARLNGLLARELPPLNHDETDAVLCAYTAHLHARGETEALGDPREGLLHVPRLAKAILSPC
jgi:predicted nuclease with RNAse H fold